jgi:cytochrome c556
MTRSQPRPTLTGVLFGALLMAATVGRADDQDTVDYRKHIMKTMGEQVASIKMILQQKAPPDNFAVHVKILAVAASTAKKAFEPKVPGGDAKPEVWGNWPDFSKRLDALVAATADLAKTAQDGGVAAARPRVEGTLTCKDCHDTYRVPKK